MLSLRDFWRRHKRKIFVSSGVLGSGYLLYKLYDSHRSRLAHLERDLARESEHRRNLDELINARMKAHFENIQRIADTTTLPRAMHHLSSRMAEELDLTHLTERLMKGKGHPNALTSSEKLDLWENLKILSFTKMVLSLWAMTALSLYIRVQVNILGRDLYIDTASGLGSSHLPEDVDLVDTNDQQKFLASSDFLSSYGVPLLISNLQVAAREVLQRKQLRDLFNTTLLCETIMQILDSFMSTENPHQWVDYLMSEDTRSNSELSYSTDHSTFQDVTKFDQLMAEARVVLLSPEFRNVLERSLQVVVDAVVRAMKAQPGGGSLESGVPLAKLIPRVAQMSPLILDEPAKNEFIKIVHKMQEVELFFTLLYSNMPAW